MFLIVIFILNYLINILTPLQLVLLVTSHTYSALLFRKYNFTDSTSGLPVQASAILVSGEIWMLNELTAKRTVFHICLT